MSEPSSHMPPPFEEEERTRARRVAGQVVHRIVDLDLQPGEAITEADLAADHDIAKPTAREALQHVATHDLVTPVRGSGYVVRPITLVDSRNLLAWWRVELTESAAFTAEHGIPTHIRDGLSKYQEAHDKAMSDGDPVLDHMTDRYFGLLSGNPYVTQSLFHLAPLVHRLARFAVNHGAVLQLTQCWEDVLEAVLQGNAQRVRTLVRQRADDVIAAVLDVLVAKAIDDQANLAGSQGT